MAVAGNKVRIRVMVVVMVRGMVNGQHRVPIGLQRVRDSTKFIPGNPRAGFGLVTEVEWG